RYPCDFPGCGASFGRARDLPRHKKIHDESLKITCPECDRTYHREDLLARHRR
ncbi:hypothetical protein BU26DRAFT_385900, partial [Trematosphaeria pertusa]